jgi:histidyl-tRNA synthetase
VKPLFRALRGTRDILPEETSRWQHLESVARDILERYGFREIRTPLVEATELFTRSVGEATDIVRKEMYRFAVGGESVTLRPEATASVVRAFLEHALHRGVAEGYPERLYYMGPMFRHERPQKGRQRQFHQIGAEILGAAEPLVDAETMDMIVTLLEALGIGGSALRIGSVGDERCRPRYRETLRQWLRPRLERMCGDCQRRFSENPLRVFDCKVERDRALVEEAPQLVELLCEPCAEHFAEVRRWLDTFGIRYEVDPRIVRGLDYYSRTVFEVVSAELGAQNALVGGGRYDGLVEALGGPSMPGFGFAAGMERLLAVLPEDRGVAPSPHVAIVSIGQDAWRASARLARHLRHEGFRVVATVCERPVQAQLRRADRLGARYAVLLGDEELRTGRIELKDLASGLQRAVGGEQELVAFLREEFRGSSGRP